MTPPKDRHFLARAYVYHWNNKKNQWEHVGFRWKEAYWNKERLTYLIWCGKEGTTTTEPLEFRAWADLPRKVNVLAESKKQG